MDFSPPANDGGAAITGYQAACYPSDGSAAGSSTFSLSSPLRVSSLTNGKTYTCTVVARNSVGVGLASAPSTPVTLTESTTVTSDGGAIHIALGTLGVDAPAGAIAAGQTLTIRTVGSSPDPLLEASILLVPMFEVVTSQGQPSLPLTLSLHHDATQASSGSVPLLLHDTSDVGGWVPEATDWNPSTGVASATVDHLSLFAWADEFRYQVGATFGSARFTGGLDCTDPPSWVTGVIFPNGVNDPVRVCAAPGTNSTTLKLSIANNRGYTQALHVNFGSLDYSHSSWSHTVDGLLNQAIALVQTAVTKNFLFLAPGSSATITLHRSDFKKGQVVTIKSQDAAIRAVAGMTWNAFQKIYALPQVAVPKSVLNCAMKGVFDDPSNATNAQSRLASCFEAARGVLGKEATDAMKKIVYAMVALNFGTKILDALEDGFYPGQIEFEVISAGPPPSSSTTTTSTTTTLPSEPGTPAEKAARYAEAHTFTFMADDNGNGLQFVLQAYRAAGVNLQNFVDVPINDDTNPRDIWDHLTKGQVYRGSEKEAPYGAVFFGRDGRAGVATRGHRTDSGQQVIITALAYQGSTLIVDREIDDFGGQVGWWLPDS